MIEDLLYWSWASHRFVICYHYWWYSVRRILSAAWMLLWEMRWYNDIGKEYIESSTIHRDVTRKRMFALNAQSWEIANLGWKLGLLGLIWSVGKESSEESKTKVAGGVEEGECAEDRHYYTGVDHLKNFSISMELQWVSREGISWLSCQKNFAFSGMTSRKM